MNTDKITNTLNSCVSAAKEFNEKVDSAFNAYVSAQKYADDNLIGTAKDNELYRAWNSFSKSRSNSETKLISDAERLCKQLNNQFSDMCGTAPSSSQINSLNSLQLRNSIEAYDVDMYLATFSGNIQSLIAFRSFLHEKVPSIYAVSVKNHPQLSIPSLNEVLYEIEQYQERLVSMATNYKNVPMGTTNASLTTELRDEMNFNPYRLTSHMKPESGQSKLREIVNKLSNV